LRIFPQNNSFPTNAQTAFAAPLHSRNRRNGGPEKRAGAGFFAVRGNLSGGMVNDSD